MREGGSQGIFQKVSWYFFVILGGGGVEGIFRKVPWYFLLSGGGGVERKFRKVPWYFFYFSFRKESCTFKFSDSRKVPLCSMKKFLHPRIGILHFLILYFGAKNARSRQGGTKRSMALKFSRKLAHKLNSLVECYLKIDFCFIFGHDPHPP